MIVHADILEWASTYDGPKFHAALMDAPYHLAEITARFGNEDAAPAQYGRDGAFQRVSKGFMGKSWDGVDENGIGVAFNPETWKAIARHLHPGAFLFVCAGTLNDDLISVAMRQAGLRKYHKAVYWGYGSGFPKATNLPAQIDEDAFQRWLLDHEAERLDLAQYRDAVRVARIAHKADRGVTPRAVVTAAHAAYRARRLAIKAAAGFLRTAGQRKHQPKFAAAELGYREKDNGYNSKERESFDVAAPATPMAQTWAGYSYGGQMIKPAAETILIFQKPYDGRPVDSITATGAGALWIDGGRVGTGENKGWDISEKHIGAETTDGIYGAGFARAIADRSVGRWPANLLISHVSMPVFRLTGNLPDGIINTIRRYYNGYSRVSELRKRSNHRANEAKRRAAVLQPEMQVGGGAEVPSTQTGNTSVPGVWDRVLNSTGMGTDGSEEVLQPQVLGSPQEEPDGRASGTFRQEAHEQDARQNRTNQDGAGDCPSRESASPVEGRADGQQRVCICDDRDTTGRSAGNGAQDAPETRVHFRAPFGDGNEAESGSGAARDGASYQWAEDRQPAREPCDSRSIPSLVTPSECGEGTSDTASRERATESGDSPLEVLLSDIPPGWLEYFDPTGEDLGCRPIGTRRVRAISGGVQTSNGYHGGITAGVRHADADGYETVAAWDCAPGCAVAALGRQSGETGNGYRQNPSFADSTDSVTGWNHGPRGERGHDDTGTAARFFFQADYLPDRLEQADPVAYFAKASRSEREAGLDPRQIALIGRAEQGESTINDGRQKPIDNPYQRGETTRRNIHPTLKPLSLARYLATLLLPPDAYAPRRLLVPFAGAGSECIGAELAGWEEVVGVELEADHVAIAEARLTYWRQRRHEFGDPGKPIAAVLSAAPAGQLDMFEEPAL